MRAAALDDLPTTPGTHFRLFFYAALIELIREAAVRSGSLESLLDRHRVLATYLNELAERGLDGGTLEAAGDWWRSAVERWEAAVPSRLPLRALARAAALDHVALTLLVGCGLAEEDPRLAQLYGGTGARVPAGLLTGWFPDLEAGTIRARLRRLLDLGLLRSAPADAPFAAWHLEVPAALWSGLRGDPFGAGPARLRWRRAEDNLALGAVCLPAALATQCRRVADLQARGALDTVVVRGPQHNGRRTLLAALARAAGRGVLEIDASRREDVPDWKLAGPLATLLDAMPVLVFDPAPGEVVTLPMLEATEGPVGVVLGPRGGLTGAAGRRVVELALPLPDLPTRRALWQRTEADLADAALDELAQGLRITTGHLCDLAVQARTLAALEGRAAPSLDDARAAARALERAGLDTLAARVATAGEWTDLVAGPEARAELAVLEARCRHRERLPSLIGEGAAVHVNAGVRALLRGPSGTGKTLAARLLARALGKDLFRIDLSTVVNKYIGETEKNLERALSCAEALDVVLLFDEGDALLARRTGVSGANDRYANLETNFLLQRIESFEGILLITTNLAEQIDTAFRRRIDVVVDFRLPEADERWSIFQLHLPAGHRVGASLLEQAATRCTLSGGQIRNAVLHASLLALGEGEVLADGHLEAALLREYRKAGAICPLRPQRQPRVAAA